MDIVILGAIPHGITAKASTAYIEKQAPVFARLLQTHQAQQHWLDIAHLGCTPFEYYQLRQAGYQATSDDFWAQGLAALRCRNNFTISDVTQPIYLMELTYVEMGLHAAHLYLAEELQISLEDSSALFESARPLFQQSPYQLLHHQGNQALVSMGEDFSTPLMSPALLATGHLNDWQTPSDLPRPLRNLLSELQMLWHSHPVNNARAAKGLKPINSAWIYGGASLQDFQQTTPQTTHFIDTLAFSHLHQDWEKWLLQLPTVDQQLATFVNQGHRFILCGFDRLVTLNPKPLWSRLLSHKNAWQQWWSAEQS